MAPTLPAGGRNRNPNFMARKCRARPDPPTGPRLREPQHVDSFSWWIFHVLRVLRGSRGSQARTPLECAGRAQRRRRFGSVPNGDGTHLLMRATAAKSKAAWRYASRRTPKCLLLRYDGARLCELRLVLHVALPIFHVLRVLRGSRGSQARTPLECAGRAQRRRRFGSVPNGDGTHLLMRATAAKSKAA